jgi:hypothetical protein
MYIPCKSSLLRSGCLDLKLFGLAAEGGGEEEDDEGGFSVDGVEVTRGSSVNESLKDSFFFNQT